MMGKNPQFFRTPFIINVLDQPKIDNVMQNLSFLEHASKMFVLDHPVLLYPWKLPYISFYTLENCHILVHPIMLCKM